MSAFNMIAIILKTKPNVWITRLIFAYRGASGVEIDLHDVDGQLLVIHEPGYIELLKVQDKYFSIICKWIFFNFPTLAKSHLGHLNTS